MTERLNMPNQFSEGCRCLCAMQPWLEIQRRFFIMSIIYSFSQDWQSLSPFTVIIIFFTRFVPLIHNEQMTPLTLQLQVLIRLNMGEDVNQKHYPRSERLPGIHYYDITYMHIIHIHIYNYIFNSYHIVIVAQRSFQSFFAIFNFSVALSVLQICQIWHWLLSRLESVQRTRENGHVFIPFTYQSRESELFKEMHWFFCQTLFFIVHYYAFL